MRGRIIALLLGLLGGLLLKGDPILRAYGGESIAFLPFRDRSGFEGSWDLSQEVPAFLADSLAKICDWEVRSPAEVIPVLQRRNLRPQTSQDVSILEGLQRELGVRYLIVGEIRDFGVSHFIAGTPILGGYETYKARVVIRFRIFDGHRSQIIYTGESVQEISQRDLGLTLLGKPSRWMEEFDRLRKLEFGSAEFRRTIVGKVMTQVCGDFIAQLRQELNLAVSPTVEKPPVEGVVLLVKGDQVYINLGREDPISVGDLLTVYAPSEPLRDPNTGELLGHAEEPVGWVKILYLKGPHLSIARLIEGKAAPKQVVRR